MVGSHSSQFVVELYGGLCPVVDVFWHLTMINKTMFTDKLLLLNIRVLQDFAALKCLKQASFSDYLQRDYNSINTIIKAGSRPLLEKASP